MIVKQALKSHQMMSIKKSAKINLKTSQFRNSNAFSNTRKSLVNTNNTTEFQFTGNRFFSPAPSAQMPLELAHKPDS